jgi:hypothetical protein
MARGSGARGWSRAVGAVQRGRKAMRTWLAGLLLVAVSACMPAPRRIEVAWGPNPWYSYCTWDAPCWYSDRVIFVYGWGYLDRPTYVALFEHPARREGWSHRRRNWHPRKRPEYRGRDWDRHKKNQGDHDHRDKHGH